MGENGSAWKVKGISAPPEWWERLEEAQKELGVTSRSNLIRIAVDDYLKDNLVDKPAMVKDGA